MSLLQAILLGIVQGLTEFIPISSTAHLVLAGRVMNLALTPEQTTASIAVIQLGTLIAVILYFAGDIWNICRAFIGDHLVQIDRKSTRLNSSHQIISYAVFCLKKKKDQTCVTSATRSFNTTA